MSKNHIGFEDFEALIDYMEANMDAYPLYYYRTDVDLKPIWFSRNYIPKTH